MTAIRTNRVTALRMPKVLNMLKDTNDDVELVMDMEEPVCEERGGGEGR